MLARLGGKAHVAPSEGADGGYFPQLRARGWRQGKAHRDALETAGHGVWWDREIGAGSSFSSDIEAALERAELVVVLWSRHAIKSDWVRDEAAIGRDSGRLVPALLDSTQPPLGFRQYQAVPLPARRGLDPLIDAIECKLVGKPAKGATLKPSGFWDNRRAIRIAAAILVMLVGAAVGWRLLTSAGGGHTIAVVPASASGADSVELARLVARDLGQLRAGPIGSLTIVDPTAGNPKAAEFRLDIAQSGSGRDLQADVAMTQRGARGLLWSSVIEEPGGRTVDLRQQVSAQIGDVLNCLAELGDRRRLIRPESLSLFLRGCALGDDSQAIAVFRQLTEREPAFGPGWANLAMVSAWNVSTAVDAERFALIRQARLARDRAKQLSPDLPETAVAEAIVRPSGGAREAAILRIMDSAIARNPDSALLRGTRADALAAIGRMNEAVAEIRRAKELNPLSPALLDLHASMLAYSGNVDAAYAALADAEKSWPGSSRIANARYRLDLRFGDPKRAEAFLQRSAANTDIAPNVTIAFLKAREEPTAARIEATLDGYRAEFRREPVNSPPYIAALAMFGRVDELFTALENDIAADSVGAGSDVLFRPYFARVRADPRFMTLAKRLGLVEVWQQTKIWPDYCDEPGLPYDCKAEAAKVRSVKALTPIVTGPPR